MSEQMLTEDHRCGRCGEPVVSFEGEPHTEVAIDGYMQTLAMAYVLKPCGHVFVKAVR